VFPTEKCNKCIQEKNSSRKKLPSVPFLRKCGQLFEQPGAKNIYKNDFFTKHMAICSILKKMWQAIRAAWCGSLFCCADPNPTNMLQRQHS